MEIRRLFDIIDHNLEIRPDQQTALGRKDDSGEWIRYSLKEYAEQTNAAAYALLQLGLKEGDKVAIISSNRPEWNMLDMAVMKIGCITVPIYPTISEQDYLYILNHCEARMAVAEGAEVLHKTARIQSQTPNLEWVYTFSKREGFPCWEQFLEFGRQHRNPEGLTARAAGVNPEDCSTIMYTSGTTGTPKGVMLSHMNIVSQLEALHPTMADWSHTALSFLPLCHAYERMLVFLYQYRGLSVYYPRNLGTIGEDIRSIRPTMMSTVPLMLEKMYDKIYQSGKKLKGISRILFYDAVELAERYRIEKCERSLWYRIRHRIADRLVYRRIRKQIGSDFDIIVSGSAMIRPQLVSFFSAIGMPVYEGYGMTEASPVIAVSCNEKYGREAGTVGFPLPGVEVDFTAQGELICRGHNVMMGYYKDEALTRSVIDGNGWLHTGDMGRFTAKGQVVITGRLKNLFKSSLGKYINASLIEAQCGASPLIQQVVAFGENRRFVTALIRPDAENLKQWCRDNRIPYTDLKEMTQNSDVLRMYQDIVNRCNASLGEAEKIRKFQLTGDEWSTENGILTPTLKIRRAVVEKQYSESIEAMYR